MKREAPVAILWEFVRRRSGSLCETKEESSRYVVPLSQCNVIIGRSTLS